MPPDARIIYAGFPTRRTSGGVRVQLEHIRLLRAAGRDARLWLPEPDVAGRADGLPHWFPTGVPVVFGTRLEVTGADLLVLPEVGIRAGADPAPGGRVVIFNQNHFFTFAAGDDPGSAYPGWERRPGVWVVSQESVDVLAAVHPLLDIRLIPNPIDPDRYRPGARESPAVCWIPRKRSLEATLLARLLAADPRLAEVRRTPLVDVTPEEVAGALGSSTLFLSLGHTEGFGLPVAEALAAGCLVVGYDGGGGRELFDAPGAWSVPEQRPLLLAERAVDLLSRRTALAPLAAANRAWVLERHHPDRTAAALLDAVAVELARPARPTSALHPVGWTGPPPGFQLQA